MSGMKFGKADLVGEVNTALHYAEKANRHGLMLRRTGQYRGAALGWSIKTKHREWTFENEDQVRVFLLAYNDARTP